MITLTQLDALMILLSFFAGALFAFIIVGLKISREDNSDVAVPLAGRQEFPLPMLICRDCRGIIQLGGPDRAYSFCEQCAEKRHNKIFPPAPVAVPLGGRQDIISPSESVPSAKSAVNSLSHFRP